jgi:hypothetical protein
MRTALFWAVTLRVVGILLGFMTVEDGTDGLSRNVLQ